MFLDEPTTGLDPRSRNQVWDIIRALVARGHDRPAVHAVPRRGRPARRRIAVIDHGRVIAEGTPGQLKASVGQGTLHVAAAEPEQRGAAERGAVARRSTRRCTSSPTRPRCRCPVDDAERAAEAVAELFAAGVGSPTSRSASRASTRCSSRSPATRRGGARRRRPHEHRRPPPERSAEPAAEAAVHAALASGERPPRPSALSGCLTFGWRGMLKIKHVPEQLLDVSMTPVLFLLMFTYLFGGAVAGSTDEYLQFLLPGVLVQSVLFTAVYSGVALNTDITKGVVDRFRSLPMWRPAPLVGAVVGDSARYVIAATVVMVARRRSWASRPAAGSAAWSPAIALVVVFAFGLSWVFTTVGLADARAQRGA